MTKLAIPQRLSINKVCFSFFKWELTILKFVIYSSSNSTLITLPKVNKEKELFSVTYKSKDYNNS